MLLFFSHLFFHFILVNRASFPSEMSHTFTTVPAWKLGDMYSKVCLQFPLWMSMDANLDITCRHLNPDWWDSNTQNKEIVCLFGNTLVILYVSFHHMCPEVWLCFCAFWGHFSLFYPPLPPGIPSIVSVLLVELYLPKIDFYALILSACECDIIWE